MNRRELNEAIKLEMQIDPAIVNDLERYRFINRAVADLASTGLFEKMATPDLNATVNPVDLPSDFISEIGVYRVEGDKVVPLSPSPVYRSLVGGTPSEYFILNNQLYLIPFSPCTIRLLYSYRPAGVSETEDEAGDTSSPTLPEDWHTLIIPYAVAMCHLKSGSVARYQQYMNDYNERKSVKIMEYLKTYNSRVRVPKPVYLDYPVEV